MSGRAVGEEELDKHHRSHQQHPGLHAKIANSLSFGCLPLAELAVQRKAFGTSRLPKPFSGLTHTTQALKM